MNDRKGVDDPELTVTGIFTKLKFDFNNEDIVVELPDNSNDVDLNILSTTLILILSHSMAKHFLVIRKIILN